MRSACGQNHVLDAMIHLSSENQSSCSWDQSLLLYYLCTRKSRDRHQNAISYATFRSQTTKRQEIHYRRLSVLSNSSWPKTMPRKEKREYCCHVQSCQKRLRLNCDFVNNQIFAGGPFLSVCPKTVFVGSRDPAVGSRSQTSIHVAMVVIAVCFITAILEGN